MRKHIFIALAVLLLFGCGSAKKLTSINEKRDVKIETSDSSSTFIDLQRFFSQSEYSFDKSKINIRFFYPRRNPADTTEKQDVLADVVVDKDIGVQTNINETDTTKIAINNIKKSKEEDNTRIETEIVEKTGPTWWQRFQSTVFWCVISVVFLGIVCWWMKKGKC